MCCGISSCREPLTIQRRQKTEDARRFWRSLHPAGRLIDLPAEARPILVTRLNQVRELVARASARTTAVPLIGLTK